MSAKNSVVSVFWSVVLLVTIGCGPATYITRTEGVSSGGRTDVAEGKTVYYAVSCSRDKRECIDGYYYECVYIEGDCECHEGKHCGKNDDDCTDVRVCNVNNVRTAPSDIAELTGEGIFSGIAEDALQCSPSWHSNTGHKNGSLWAHIPAKDHLCRPSTPVE